MGVAYFLDRVQGDHLHRRLHWIKELTTAARAADLLMSHRCIAGQDNCLERWPHVEVQSLCGKGYQGCQHSSASCHIGVVQAILRIFGLRTETKQKRIDGGVVRVHRITDPLQHFNPDKLLKHWEAKPELVLGDLEAANDGAGVTDYP